MNGEARRAAWSAGRRAVGVLVCGMLLAGCSLLGGNDPEPAASTETAAPAPPPSPSPAIPAAAKKMSNDGAIAFVRYWFSAYNHSTWELASAELTPISDSSCAFCNRAKQAVENLKATSRRAEGGRTTIANVKLIRGSSTEKRLDISYDQTASSIVDAAGTKLSTAKATKSGKLLVAVKWTGKQWTMLEVVVLS